MVDQAKYFSGQNEALEHHRPGIDRWIIKDYRPMPSDVSFLKMNLGCGLLRAIMCIYGNYLAEGCLSQTCFLFSSAPSGVIGEVAI